jgi:hypothetical protein
MKMMIRGIALGLAALLLSDIGISYTQEHYQDRATSEELVAPVNSSIWLPDTFKMSPDRKRAAYVAQIDNEQFVIVDGIEGRCYDSIQKGSLVFSTDSKRFAYVAKEGSQQIVIVDGREEKMFDKVLTNPLFSPDCRKVVYVAQAGDKVCVVVDGKEGRFYDDVLNTGSGKIVFDSPDQIHYYARNGDSVVYVEERIK